MKHNQGFASRPTMAALCVIVAVVMSGCGEQAGRSNSEGDKISIVATSGMVADIVRTIAGDRASVRGMMGEGVDPHTYEPTRSDVAALAGADVIFYSGLTLEGRMEETFARLKEQGKAVFAVTDCLSRDELRQPPQYSGHYDPHVWMNVAMWKRCMEYAAKSLSEHDPDGADYYQANAKTYGQELEKLHEYARKTIAAIPAEHRALITAHDAFEYFGEEYDLPVRAVQGLSPESQPSLNEMNRLTQFIATNQISAIFVESSVNKEAVRSIIEGCRETYDWELDIGGELFSDAMGAPGTYEGTYLGMIDHNVTTIAQALGANPPPPPGGMHGKLRRSE